MNDLDFQWVEKVKKKYPKFFAEVKVLELGSLDVNGSVWSLFEESMMIGVDWIEGKNVTYVVRASETKFDKDFFDVLLSLNHLEHDAEWKETLTHNLPFLRKGGLLILRWADLQSSPHGPEFDVTKQNGYYPKGIREVEAFLVEQGVQILERSQQHNPAIGVMSSLLGLYSRE